MQSRKIVQDTVGQSRKENIADYFIGYLELEFHVLNLLGTYSSGLPDTVL